MTLDEMIATCAAKDQSKGSPLEFPVSRHKAALAALIRYGQIDGAHHKTWTIDQAVRYLAGEHYDELIRIANDGEDGPDTYEWDTGTPP